MAKAKKSKAAAPDRSGQFNIRFPDPALRDRIAQVAADTGRSMNEVIVSAIVTGLDHITPKADLNELTAQVRKLSLEQDWLERSLQELTARVDAIDGGKAA